MAEGTDQRGREVMRIGVFVVVHTHVFSFGCESTGTMTEQQLRPASLPTANP